MRCPFTAIDAGRGKAPMVQASDAAGREATRGVSAFHHARRFDNLGDLKLGGERVQTRDVPQGL